MIPAYYKNHDGLKKKKQDLTQEIAQLKEARTKDHLNPLLSLLASIKRTEMTCVEELIKETKVKKKSRAFFKRAPEVVIKDGT